LENNDRKKVEEKKSKGAATGTPNNSEFNGLSTEKQKALSAALAQIEKQFGKGSIMRLRRRGDRSRYIRLYQRAH
jgi:hypothetical protein